MDELKQNIKNTKALAEEYENAGERLAIAKKEFFDMEIEILGSALGMLMKKINEAVDDWIKVNAEKIDNDKKLATDIKQSIEKAITAVAQKPIEFKPQIKVDIQPIANEISRQNDAMIKMMNKLSVNDDNTGELHRSVIVMIQKQMTFLEQAFKRTDYSNQLNELLTIIREEVKPKPVVESLEVIRDDRGIKTLKPIYKTTKK